MKRVLLSAMLFVAAAAGGAPLFDLGAGRLLPDWIADDELRAQLRDDAAQRAATRATTLARLRALLLGYAEAGGRDAVLLLHDAAQGEPLIDALLLAYPASRIVLTHMTPTGRATGRALFARHGARLVQSYLPYDTGAMPARFIRHFAPRICILMETEVWPNLMSEAKRCGVPMVLANARESEKSRAQAEKFLDVMGPAFGSFTAILAQSEEDKERLESLGGRNVTVCGSVKFDIRPNASQEAAARAWKASLSRPVALIASTRQGEEVLFAKAMATRPQLLRRAQFWLVPRHPQRFDEVAGLVASAMQLIKSSKA